MSLKIQTSVFKSVSPFYKKTSGILKVESVDGRLDLSAVFLNLPTATDGVYLLKVKGNVGEVEKVVGERGTNVLLSFDGSLPVDALLLFKGKDEIPVCFASGSGTEYSADFSPKSEYDDEAVAEENYYLFDGGSENREMGSNRDEISVPCADGEKEGKTVALKDKGVYDETNVRACYGGKNYENEIKTLFSRFSKENELSQTVYGSKFVDAVFSGKNELKIGVTGDGKYLAFAVKGRFSLCPPDELKGVATFVPASFYDETDGYWLILRDLNTGELVRTEE
ncbi:MAG: hypothetical protein MJ072_02875 [Clostridia bacterium]|nr:hypothetical protein [Clostridia bacterium]